jgi:hypothetical protein
MEKLAYAKLRNEAKNKWYNIWIKEGKNGIYVHGMYGSYQIITPVEGARFWELDWGMWNSTPIDSFSTAVIIMNNKISEKLNGGYEILEQVVT